MSDKKTSFMSFVQSKGFVWGPSPEIYGGIAGFYTYGPLGKLLKNNVEQEIRKVFSRNNFWEVECPTVMPKEVWEASGHLGGFTDPMIQCSKCNANFRVDTLIEEFVKDADIAGLAHEDLLKVVKENNLKCPNCKSAFKDNIIRHSLMMRTTIGLETEAYNRPETATTTYLPFIRYVDYFRKKVPFSVFQIGKAYRNEISPRQHLLRMREFTQAEGQLFISEEQKKDFAGFDGRHTLPLLASNAKEVSSVSLSDALKKKLIKSKAYAWTLHVAYELFTSIGIPKDKIRFRQHHHDEKAFYADDAWDLEVQTSSYGWVEMAGIHDRTDYDLTQHAKHSKKELSMLDENNQRIVPHILEIAFGVDRPVFALLDLFYDYKAKDEGKTTFHVPYKVAPIKAAILPLMKKDELKSKAKEVYALLIEHMVVKYDESGQIGRRYLRENESGTPYCITVDFDSLEKNDVTIRDRDSGAQVRVPINNIHTILTQLLADKISFKDAGMSFETKE